MKSPIFLGNYNRHNHRINTGSSKLLIIADCKVDHDFVNILSERLKVNVDLLYIDTSRRTRKKVVERHLSYLILAIEALLIENEYDNIIFWQQFIGLYWNLMSRLKRRKKVETFLLPLIYKSRKGIIGKIHRFFFRFSLSYSALTGAICHSSRELKHYHKIFPKCKNKIFFVPYGKSCKTKNKNISVSVATPYFFSGGTSNRDYSTLFAAAKKVKYNFVIACTTKDIAGIDVPNNVRVFFDAYDEKFDVLINSSNAVILPLENTDISSGQLVLLEAMEMRKPIVATRGAGILDYVDETCAFLVDSKNVGELQRVLEFIIGNLGRAKSIAEKAKKRHQECFTTQSFAFSIAEVVIHKNRNRSPLV